MLELIQINHRDGCYQFFTLESESGHTAKDVMRIPGVYDEVCSECCEMALIKLYNSSIGGVPLGDIFALAVGRIQHPDFCRDWTAKVSQIVGLPKTAQQSVINSLPENEQAIVRTSCQMIEMYKSVTVNESVCMPAEALNLLEEETRQRMQSARKSYSLKAIDNQEIFATSPDAEFCIKLPSLEEIHEDTSSCFSTMDLLRVLAPFRKPGPGNSMQYQSIYHTPYYKVDPRLRGIVPTQFSWIDGMSVNDIKDIRPCERRMFNNILTLVCADTSRNVTAIATGLFFQSTVGTALRVLLGNRNSDVVSELHSDMLSKVSDGCEITLSLEDSQAIFGSSDSASVLGAKVHVTVDFIKQLLGSAGQLSRHVVDTDNLPFTLRFTDAEEAELSDLFVSSVITRAMHEFLLHLCTCAYAVNWGHTGAARAISALVGDQGIANIDTAMATYLTRYTNKGTVNSAAMQDASIAVLYPSEDSYDDEDDGREVDTQFDYYVTTETIARILSGNLAEDYFSTKATGAEGASARIVEYWRITNGAQNLQYFLDKYFYATGDFKVFIQAAIRLMRWGEHKPKLLVLTDHPKIRTVFDLVTGMETENVAILDDSQIIKVNGCKFQLKKALYLPDNDSMIAGFELIQDYGVCQKSILASWDELNSLAMSEDGLAEFTAVYPFDLSNNHMVNITTFSKTACDFFVTDSNIEQGMALNIAPPLLADLQLMVRPGILESREYLRSLRNDVLVTTVDRQFSILHNYYTRLCTFWTEHSQEVRDIKTSADIKRLAAIFAKTAKVDNRQDANTAYAASALQAMSFGEIEYDKRQLVGKFILITDAEQLSDIDGIKFTDPQLAKLASKINNRVILLMAEDNDCFLLCRQDIMASSLDVRGGKIVSYTYKMLQGVYEGLLRGDEKFIKVGDMRKPVKLHETVR